MSGFFLFLSLSFFSLLFAAAFLFSSSCVVPTELSLDLTEQLACFLIFADLAFSKEKVCGVNSGARNPVTLAVGKAAGGRGESCWSPRCFTVRKERVACQMDPCVQALSWGAAVVFRLLSKCPVCLYFRRSYSLQ